MDRQWMKLLLSFLLSARICMGSSRVEGGGKRGKKGDPDSSHFCQCLIPFFVDASLPLYIIVNIIVDLYGGKWQGAQFLAFVFGTLEGRERI